MEDEAAGRIAALEQEVAELRQELDACRRIEAFYSGLAGSTTYLMVRTDARGRFVFVNDLYCETFGKRREELVGSTFMPLVHEDDLQATMEAMKAMEAPPYRACLEQRALTVRGYRWFVWEDWAIRDASGATVEVHGVGRDITDYKELAESQARLQEAALSAQRAAMQELSTPLVPIAKGVIAMPLIGAIDSERSKQILEAILRGVGEHRASVAILDITGVKSIDTLAAGALVQAAQAVRLLGAEVVLTGIGSAIAHALVELGADFGGIVTRGTLEMGIAYALRERAQSTPVRT